MDCYRAAKHRRVPPTVRIGPRLLEHDRLVEGDLGNLGSYPSDGIGRDATAFGDALRRIFGRKVAIGE